MIMDIAKERIGSISEDMLQVILEGAENGELGPLTKDEFIADNCKSVILGGYEPPALASIRVKNGDPRGFAALSSSGIGVKAGLARSEDW
ncbi:hypothetical protein GH714_012903 [Hevea brasiliensis]|uniref:Uncharacterized protein n=1 Tax=Hevea brasiliensis TaxID=3981 RepID=A0A6A6LG39_HEVBR|nr:hypothetical protein GH714_012903 [Hevea brasiliensis]